MLCAQQAEEHLEDIDLRTCALRGWILGGRARAHARRARALRGAHEPSREGARHHLGRGGLAGEGRLYMQLDQRGRAPRHASLEGS